uniref:Uncharacterized protein n=1 Tax=Arundo donax TaxID=35708 RepID=A0A0A9BP39_ARUDO
MGTTAPGINVGDASAARWELAAAAGSTPRHTDPAPKPADPGALRLDGWPGRDSGRLDWRCGGPKPECRWPDPAPSASDPCSGVSRATARERQLRAAGRRGCPGTPWPRCGVGTAVRRRPRMAGLRRHRWARHRGGGVDSGGHARRAARSTGSLRVKGLPVARGRARPR